MFGYQFSVNDRRSPGRAAIRRRSQAFHAVQSFDAIKKSKESHCVAKSNPHH